MTIAVDLDGVICTEERTFERSLAKPLPGAVESLKWLRAQGHTVIVYTARGWAEQRTTADWLARNGLEYDLLVMGKPISDVWIDDRAIRFRSWDQVRQDLAAVGQSKRQSDTQYPADEFALKENRRVTFEFLHELAKRDLPDPIVEVGPMLDGRQNPASPLHRWPEYYVNSRELFMAQGKSYRSLDVDAESKPDIVGDVANIDSLLKPESVGTIIMLHVLEHVPQLFEIPKRLQKVLVKGGLLCLQTPWNLRFHGPRPDCWRISDDGYHALFDPGFEFLSLERTETPGRELMPHCFAAVLKRK